MEHLIQKHLEIIEGAYTNKVGDPIGEAKQHAELTAEECVKFYEWIKKNPKETIYAPTKLFDQYLEHLEKQK
jgi:hypothetical protein